MKLKPIGITLEFGCTEHEGKRKWFVYAGSLKQKKMRASYKGIDSAHGGIKFDMVFGSWRRPVPRLFRFGFWKRGKTPYDIWEQEYNPWNSGRHWFEIPDIRLPAFFLSIGKEDNEAYVGWKSYDIDRISQNLKKYMPDRNDVIFDDVAWGSPDEKGNTYLAASACLRLKCLKDFFKTKI